jgi:PAS domain S-box-containing protein
MRIDFSIPITVLGVDLRGVLEINPELGALINTMSNKPRRTLSRFRKVANSASRSLSIGIYGAFVFSTNHAAALQYVLVPPRVGTIFANVKTYANRCHTMPPPRQAWRRSKEMVNVKAFEKASNAELPKALLASELRYRRLFESAKDGILILNAETGQIDDVNPFLIELLGYSRDQFVNKAIWDIGFFKDIIANQDNFLQLKERKYIRYKDLPLETADGRKIDVEFVSNVYPENNHNVIQCNIRDITERKRGEQERFEAASRFRGVFEQSPVGSLFVGMDKRFIRCNPAFYRFLGYPESELIGKLIADVTHPEDVELGIKELQHLAEGSKESFTVQKRYLRKDGSIVWGEVSVSLVRDAQNTPLYFLPIIADITDRKRLEEDHLKYELRLQQDQKLESLGVLAGGIAHDFNNLMGGFFGYIDLAREAANDPRVTSYLSKAMATIDRARGLTAQLLTFAKGGAPVRKTATLNPFIQETAQFALSGSNVSCRFDVPPDLWLCNFDKNQLSQVIDNIIINAQQAMPLGGTIELIARNLILAIKEHPTLAKGHYVKISIKDKGIGMPKELIPKIFDPFFTTKAKGHGLGLATCYSIVKRHDGCIEVESEMGAGSTFHIYLPASTESVSSAANSSVAVHRGSGIFLVMDDEDMIREIITDMLISLGYTVVCTQDGKEAIDFFQTETKNNRPLSGMIFDLTVPGGMGGRAAVAEIRKLNREIPVFVASGYAEDPVMKNPAEYGFMASICKPFNINELSAMLNKYIKTKNSKQVINKTI